MNHLLLLRIGGGRLDLHSFPTRRSSDLALGYRLQALRKTQEGTSHPDRNAQFEHINAAAAACPPGSDRKSTRMNSSHTVISYAVFCLKKQNIMIISHIHIVLKMH